MYQILWRFHSQLPVTTVWAYGQERDSATVPGPIIEATRWTTLIVRWRNYLPLKHLLPVDTTLHKAHPKTNTGIPTVVHLHGGVTDPVSDGHPDAWFTKFANGKIGEPGPAWRRETSIYNNKQQAATLWYHDHALGLGRLASYAGLAGTYIIREPAKERALKVPSGKFDVVLSLTDITFTSDGQLYYDISSATSSHPKWAYQQIGKTIAVNGRLWPYFKVEPRRYRFRILNASVGGRNYILSFGSGGPSLIQIATDQGYIAKPITVTTINLTPAERIEVIVDFTSFAGKTLLLSNSGTAFATAPSEYTSRVMQFRVGTTRSSPDTSVVPASLVPIENIKGLKPYKTRVLHLAAQFVSGGFGAFWLDGKRWNVTTSEVPKIGTVEVWKILNLTPMLHPIHLHIAQFQARLQQFRYMDVNKYNSEAYFPSVNRWRASHGNAAAPPFTDNAFVTPDPTPYLVGTKFGPDPTELGWKDTVRAEASQLTVLAVRWAPNWGGAYPFDVTAFPGYAWHCHVAEHEDNEMMRSLKLVK
eukprot:jgi/Chlat1/6400/Chrsp45S09062